MNIYKYYLYPEELNGHDREKFIVPDNAYYYALNQRQRTPEVEPFIMKSPYYAGLYARTVLHHRWPEAESTIAKSPEAAFVYALHILQGRFPEAESYIKTDPYNAFQYAMFILKHRWPEAEPYIKRVPHFWQLYVNNFGDPT